MSRGPKAKIEFTEELIGNIADHHLKGRSLREIATETGISHMVIRRALRAPEMREELKKRSLQVLASLLPLAHKALRAQLEENNLDAVKIVYKAYQIIDAEPIAAAKADTGITIIMPGAGTPEKEVINVSQELPEGEQGEAK